MAMSNITVKGITPELNILGAYQNFVYTDNLSTFRTTNQFVPTISIPSVMNYETRNNALSGFRWIHTTINTDTHGSLKLQRFVNAETTGIDLLSFNQDGTMNIIAPITFTSLVLPVSQIAGYPSDATVFLRGDGTWSPLSITVNTIGYSIVINTINFSSNFNDFVVQRSGISKAAFGYNAVNDETYCTAYGTAILKFISTGTEKARFTNTGQFLLQNSTVLNVNNQKIINVLDPTSAQDAATKNYVDARTITLIGDVTGSGVVNANITTTLSNNILRPTGTIFNYNTLGGGFIEHVITDPSVLQFDQFFIQNYTGLPAFSGYRYRYTPLSLSLPQPDSFYFSHVQGAAVANIWSHTASGTGAMTIYSGLSMNSTEIADVLKLGIGISAANTNVSGSIQFPASNANRRIVLWQVNNNDHEFHGFGIAASTLRVQLPSTSNDFVLYAATSSTTSVEVFRAKGTGDVVYSGTIYGRNHVGSCSFQSNVTTTTVVTAGTPVKIAGVTSAGVETNGFSTAISNRVQNTGPSGYFNIDTTIAVSASATSTLYLVIYKNGALITTSRVPITVTSTGTIYQMRTISPVQLDTNDYAESWVDSSVNSNTLTVPNLILTAKRT